MIAPAICPNGHSNREGARFCARCGAPIAGAAPAVAAPLAVPEIPKALRERAGSPRGLRVPFGLIATLPGMLIVTAAFFMDWLVISSPAASFLTITSQPERLSGARILTFGPATFESFPAAIICVVPGLAVGALLLGVLAAVRAIPLRLMLSSLALLSAAVGIIFMIALLSVARAQVEQVASSFGLQQVLGWLVAKALVDIQPGLGLWATIFGFGLIGLGAVADLITQLVWE